VLVIILGAFAVPAEQQPKALTIGIVLALGLRAVFIALGAALLAAFSFMFLIFGLTLVATAVQLYRHRNEDPTVEDNALVTAARRALPISPHYEQGQIITRLDGRRVFTPLLLVPLAIGSTDLLFAFDSIPAVFGVTDHAYIVFAANAFALLGLRALYFLVAGLLDRLVYLSKRAPIGWCAHESPSTRRSTVRGQASCWRARSYTYVARYFHAELVKPGETLRC
jgi:tellurite resistance protein TerC